jgi:formiminotetrahydrofolate cyclodeaminase
VRSIAERPEGQRPMTVPFITATDFRAMLDTELEASGWNKANRHFEAAVQATIDRDDEAYERAMAAFREVLGGRGE